MTTHANGRSPDPGTPKHGAHGNCDGFRPPGDELLARHPPRSRRYPIAPVVLASLCLCLVVFPTVTTAVDAQSPIPTYTAAIPGSFPPEYVVDSAQEPTGYAIDVLNAIARIAHFKVRYKVYSDWKRAGEAVQNGDADLIPMDGITAKRRHDFSFSYPVDNYEISIFVRHSTNSIHSLSDLKGHTVAVVRTNAAIPILERMADVNLLVLKHPDDALVALVSGQADAMVFPEPVMLSIARHKGLDSQIKIVGKPLVEIQRAMAVKKHNYELLVKLNPAILEFVKSKGFKSIYVQYYGKSLSYWTPERVAWAIGIAVLLTALAGASWRFISVHKLNRRLRQQVAERERAVTQLEGYQQELSQREERFRAIIENSVDIIMMLDANGKILLVNPAVSSIIGRDVSQVQGQSIFAFIHDDDAEELLNRMRNRFEVSGNETLQLRIKDLQEHWRTLAARGRHLSSKIGEATMVVILRDITENLKLEEQLRQSQKMEAVGLLAGGIAHDFNNLLAIIRGFGELLKLELPAGHSAHESLDHILSAEERAAGLTRQLLTFSRREVVRPDVLDLHEVVEESRKLLRRTIGEHIELITRSDAGRYLVLADRGQIEQIIMNLSINARDAMPNGGTLEISIGKLDAENAVGALDSRLKDRNYVQIVVSDTGVGMSESVRSRVFEPFFTTKAADRGTGLGLATVYGIVGQLEGSISVQSRQGSGTTFRIYLPLYAGEKERREDSESIPIEAVKSVTVLVVEDEPGVRAITSALLRQEGFTVLEASNGQDAWRMVLEGGDKIGLVITDMVMPKMSGRELGERIAKHRPELPLVFMSSYTDDVVIRQEVINDGREFLQKPFSTTQLLRAMHRAMHRSDPGGGGVEVVAANAQGDEEGATD